VSFTICDPIPRHFTLDFPTFDTSIKYPISYKAQIPEWDKGIINTISYKAQVPECDTIKNYPISPRVQVPECEILYFMESNLIRFTITDIELSDIIICNILYEINESDGSLKLDIVELLFHGTRLTWNKGKTRRAKI